MEIEAKTLPGLEFGSEQTTTFAPIAPTIGAFAEEHGLSLERTFDRDPLMTFAAYFLSWPTETRRGAFISVSALNPLVIGTAFQIRASQGLKRHQNQKREFSISEGQERLVAILLEAKQFIEDQPTK